MNTETRRKASAAYHAKRTAEGARKVTVWLSEADRDTLDAFRGVLGSKDAAVSAALQAYRGPAVGVVAAKPAKPASAPNSTRSALLVSRLKGEWKPR